ncbi:hypothetical protein MTO96_043562 [Rhipicephalus appendiculatus]
MAKVFSLATSEETGGSKPKLEAAQDENTRDVNGELKPNEKMQRRVHISEASGHGSHALPAYMCGTVRDCTTVKVLHRPAFPKMAAIPYKPETSGAGSDFSHHPYWNQLSNQARAAATERRHQEHQDNLAEPSRGVVAETHRMLQSMKMSAEYAVTTAPCVPSISQTWIPFNLSQRVSRVYYYSRGYAEEVASGPLEMAGYTMRLSLTCAVKRKDVVLSFHGQFCARTVNDNVTWPFRGELELTIHHPTEPSRSHVYRLRPMQGRETIMPRIADNVPMRLAGPIKVSALDEERFVGGWDSSSFCENFVITCCVRLRWNKLSFS